MNYNNDKKINNEHFIWRHRVALVHTLRAIRSGKLTVGYVGGSITDGRGFHNWPQVVTAWFVENFPEVRIQSENAAIGATSSDLAVFRAQRDLIDRGCDIVFVEYAANDLAVEPIRRMRTREGLLRKLLRDGNRDVVCVYTFMQEMYEEMMRGEVPKSIADFEILCEHYGLGSVWMGRYALDEILKGRMRWEEWLPDALHPKERGSLSYAQSVIKYLEKELRSFDRINGGHPVYPDPIDPLNWENTCMVPFDCLQLTGPWVVRRSLDSVWMDQILSTSAPGSRVKLTFEGRAILIGFDYGKKSAEIRYTIDGGEPQTTLSPRADWVPDCGMFLLRSFGEELSEGEHVLEFETVNASQLFFPATRCEIAFIGLVK